MIITYHLMQVSLHRSFSPCAFTDTSYPSLNTKCFHSTLNAFLIVWALSWFSSFPGKTRALLVDAFRFHYITFREPLQTILMELLWKWCVSIRFQERNEKDTGPFILKRNEHLDRKSRLLIGYLLFVLWW